MYREIKKHIHYNDFAQLILFLIRTHLTCNESDRQDNKSVRVIRNVHETIDVWILRVAAHRDYA